MSLVSNKPITPTGKGTKAALLDAAATTTKVDLTTALAGAPRDVKAILVTNTIASTRVLQLWRHDGTTAWLIGSFLIPASAGNDGAVPTFNVLQATLLPGLQVDVAQKSFLTLGPGEKLQASLTVTAASGQVVASAEFNDYAAI